MLRLALLALLLPSSGLAQQSPAPPALLTPTSVDPAGDAPPALKPAATEPAPTVLPLSDVADLRVRLVYSPGPWATSCPSLDEVRTSIQNHLGYDPFGEPADRVVLLLLDGDGSPERARVELLDPDMHSLGTRSVSSSEGCDELVATAALQVSIAVDPSHVGRPVVADFHPTTPPAVPPPKPEVPAVVKPLTPELAFYGASAHVGVLLTPQIFMLGGSVYGGLRWQWLSARLEGRAEFPGAQSSTTSVPLLASVVPCAHLPVFATAADEKVEVLGCLTASTGFVPTLGSLNGVGVYAGVGGRAGLDWRLDDGSVLRAFLQIEGAALRTRLRSASGTEFTTPPVNALVGIGIDLPSP